MKNNTKTFVRCEYLHGKATLKPDSCPSGTTRLKHYFTLTQRTPYFRLPLATKTHLLLRVLLLLLLLLKPSHTTLPCASGPTASTRYSLVLPKTSDQGREAHHRR